MDENMMSMQEEALRRVREMKRRSQQYVPPPEPLPSDTQAPAEKPKSVSLLKDLAAIGIDEEKALIAMLIYILYKNGADIKLMLALGYLLL